MTTCLMNWNFTPLQVVKVINHISELSKEIIIFGTQGYIYEHILLIKEVFLVALYEPLILI